MTSTAYARTEPEFAEGYLHLAMAPDGTLYGPAPEPEPEPGATSDIAAEQLLEAIRSLEERMSMRIETLAAQGARAESPVEPTPLAAEPARAEALPEALPSIEAPSLAPEAADATPAPGTVEEPIPEPTWAEHSPKAPSAAPYVIVSAILIAAGIGAITLAGLYFAGVI